MTLLRFLKYPYPATRARALATNFLDSKGLHRIAGATDYDAAFSSLQKDRPIPEGLADTALEGALLGHDFLRLGQRLLRSLPRRDGRVLRAYMGRVELQNLKVACRGLLQETPEKTWKDLLVSGGPASEIPMESLREAASLEALAERARKTPYKKALRPGSKRPQEQNLFFLESDLERTFWQRVHDAVESLARFDRHAAKELLGLRADIDTFNLLYRGLDAGFEQDDILAGLPAFGVLFTPERVSRILGRDDPRAALQDSLPSEGKQPVPMTEVALYRRLYHRLHEGLREPPFDISAPLSALLLKEIESRDLRLVLAGLRFNRDPEDLKDFLATTG